MEILNAGKENADSSAEAQKTECVQAADGGIV